MENLYFLSTVGERKLQSNTIRKIVKYMRVHACACIPLNFYVTYFQIILHLKYLRIILHIFLISYI